MRYLAFIIVALLVAPATAGQYLPGISIIAAGGSLPAPEPTPDNSTECENCSGTGKVGDGTVFVNCPVCDGTGKKSSLPDLPSLPDIAVLKQQPTSEPAKVQRIGGQWVAWNGDTYNEAEGLWISPSGKTCVEPGSTERKPYKAARYVTIPAQGHYVMQRVCGAGGCRNVRVWVQTAPARRVRVDRTSIEQPRIRQSPAYPSRPIGRRWTFNGGPITAAHLAGGHHSHEHFDPNWLNSLSFSQIQALGSDSHNGHTRRRNQYIVRTH